ncbi:MAG: enoyl-CoA hydratase/isomerase family protein [Chloroflexi bacterium]|nr:enoyl-CoA hydratase/isomerase family protein [Chloroflexota bacterium]
MAYQFIKLDRDGPVAVITLNRPERLNAIGIQMVHDMNDALDEIEKDQSIRVYIVTGAPRAGGRPCFCAGADLRMMVEENPPRTFTLEINELFNRVEDLMKPSIAAIDGVCTAGGIELAEACDLRVAAETAQISDLHLKNLGNGLGGAGASTRLTKIVGPARAKELILTGGVWDGKKAEQVGFANWCVPGSQLLPAAKDVASKIAAMRPQGVAAALIHCDMTLNMDFYQALRYSFSLRDWMGDRLGTGEEGDARASFVRKEAPPWEKEQAKR